MGLRGTSYVWIFTTNRSSRWDSGVLRMVDLNYKQVVPMGLRIV